MDRHVSSREPSKQVLSGYPLALTPKERSVQREQQRVLAAKTVRTCQDLCR
jgi:hypothetical protein